MPSGIKSITPIRSQPAQERLNAPASVSLGTVAMMPGQRLSHQAAGSTSQATSWPLDHCIWVRKSTRMMMMRTGRIPERRAEEWAVLVMAMTMTMARVRRTRRVVRKRPGKGREQRMGSVKGTGRGRETVKGKVLLNKPQREMISLVPLRCCCRRKGMRQTRTQSAN